MKIPQELELTLNSSTFAALKADFDQVLKNTLRNMQEKGSEAAEVKVSLKISFVKDEKSYIQIADLDDRREIIIPKFDHKVSSVLQIKDEISGTLGGEFALVYDDVREDYVMREIINPQTSLGDYLG